MSIFQFKMSITEWYLNQLKEWNVHSYDLDTLEEIISVYPYEEFVDHLACGGIDEDTDFKELLWTMYHVNMEIEIVYVLDDKIGSLKDISEIHEDLKSSGYHDNKIYKFWENDKNNDNFYIINNIMDCLLYTSDAADE